MIGLLTEVKILFEGYALVLDFGWSCIFDLMIALVIRFLLLVVVLHNDLDVGHPICFL